MWLLNQVGGKSVGVHRFESYPLMPTTTAKVEKSGTVFFLCSEIDLTDRPAQKIISACLQLKIILKIGDRWKKLQSVHSYRSILSFGQKFK